MLVLVLTLLMMLLVWMIMLILHVDGDACCYVCVDDDDGGVDVYDVDFVAVDDVVMMTHMSVAVLAYIVMLPVMFTLLFMLMCIVI